MKTKTNRLFEMLKLFLLIIVFTFSFFNGEVGANNITRHFKHLTINEGLAHTDATCIEQDSLGYVWIGTNNGLQRFDGYTLKTVTSKSAGTEDELINRISKLSIYHNFIWLGTDEGLFCYDSRKEAFRPLKFKNVQKDFNFGLIEMFTIDWFGNIWIGNSRNLYVVSFDSKENTLTVRNSKEIIKNLPSDYNILRINAIENDKNGRLWIGTNKGILQIVKEGESYKFKNTLLLSSNFQFPNNYINSLFYANNELWALSNNEISAFYTRAEMPLTTDNLIKKIKNVDKGYTIYGELVTFTPIRIIVDKNNSIWGASDLGLFQIEDPMKSIPEVVLYQYSKNNDFSLSSNYINSCYIDQSNCLWVCTWGGGINYTDLEQKKFYMIQKNLEFPTKTPNDEFIRAIEQTSDGKFYFGTRNGGLNVYNPTTKTYKFFKYDPNNSNSLPNDHIRVIKSIDENMMLISTTRGSCIFNPKTEKFQRFNYGSTIDIANFFSIEIDFCGQIWCSSWRDGIFVMHKDGNQLIPIRNISTNTNEQFRLTSNQVNAIYANNEKHEIIASTDKGLNRIQLDDRGEIIKIIQYTVQRENENSLNSNYIWPIQKISNSSYWIGTLGGGLSEITFLDGFFSDSTGKYKAENFTVKDGAPSNQIESILMDEDGNLWLGGKGISKFNTKNHEFWNFDMKDGLQSNAFKIGSTYLTSDGVMYFGGINGVNYFKPSEIGKNTTLARTSMTGLKVKNTSIEAGTLLDKKIILNKSINYTSKIKLNYRENDITLYFSTFNYSNPQRCKFRYKLEGIDNEWKTTDGTQPWANYTNLSPGNYTFVVTGSNSDLIWDKNNTQIEIIIIPPWYLTIYAYIFYLVFFISIFTLGVFYLWRWMQMKNDLRLKALEEERIQDVHQMKLQFFTNISHEFKNPLSLILSPVEELLNRDMPQIQQRELLSIIHRNAKRMQKLINELMDFRRAEMGKLVLQAQFSNLSSFVNELTSSFLNFAQTKGVELQFRGEDFKLWFDHEVLSKVINNLISNSLKFTELGGKIEVIVQQVDQPKPLFKNLYSDANQQITSKCCQIIVRDTGIGISEQSLPRIFDRFFQVESKSQQHQGSGIGLALVKTLVIAHKGEILVSSERMMGTEFIVRLQISDDYLQPNEKVEEKIDDEILSDEKIDENAVKGDSISNENIEIDENDALFDDEDIVEDKQLLLIVEDNEDLRHVIRNHFSDQFRIIEAENGKIGFDIAIEEIPDLIISDIMMPVMNGIEFCRLIKNDINTSHIPVIFLSARNSVEDQIQGAESGADVFIPKPFSMKLLDIKVSQLIESRKYLKERYIRDFYSDTREITQNSRDREFLDKITSYIEENIDHNFSIQLLCREVGMCRTNLYKKVRSLTNQSLGDFVRVLRLKIAVRYIMEEECTISEAALRVGINSTSYFTKAFKAQYNMTPSQFINKYKDIEN